MYMEKEYEELQNTTQADIDEVYEYIQKMKKENDGRNFKMKFHGKDITSDMTLDEAYIEGTGMSLEEWRQEDRKRADISLEKRIEEIRSKDIDDRTDEEKQIIGEYEAREEGYQIVPYNEGNRRMSSVDGIHNLLKQNQEENGQKYCMVYEGYRINSDMDLSEVYINHDDYMKKKTDAILQKPEDQRSIEEKATLQMYEDEIEDQKMTLKFQKEIIENTLKRPEEEINAVAKESLRIAKERVRVIEALNSHREERERAEKLKNMKEQEEWYKNEMEELGKVKPFDPGISTNDTTEERKVKEEYLEVENKAEKGEISFDEAHEAYEKINTKSKERMEKEKALQENKQIRYELKKEVNELGHTLEIRRDDLEQISKDKLEKTIENNMIQ